MASSVASGLENDTRGWILCIVSGIACVFGASLICIDVVVRLFPGKRNFRIEESSGFLACSLSLSFGVMFFSSLYSILPESKEYLTKDGWSDQKASLLIMICFVGGFLGIQAISRLLHQFIPSHVVDCDHSHADSATHPNSDTCTHNRGRSQTHSHNHHDSSQQLASRKHSHHSTHTNGSHDGERALGESTPLLGARPPNLSSLPKRHASARGDEMIQRAASPLAATATRGRARTNDPAAITRRPSLLQMQQRVLSFVKDTKCNCDELGSCYGYTDPCGQECFKHISNRPSHAGHGHILRTTTGPFYPPSGSVFHDAHHRDHEAGDAVSPRFRTSRATSRDLLTATDEEDCDSDDDETCAIHASDDVDEDPEAQHHHHVPTNAFLSIGLQTSIAIALHKFPEGFITYATNHANPSLGFSVFLALFVHNISEGFAMALPLYMALGSRWKAIVWSALLGGLSQPLGAAIAVLWFKLTNSADAASNAVAYACLFAITAGIMVSVALQLFVESLSINHNRNLCIFFGFLGMCLLGFSNALLGHH